MDNVTHSLAGLLLAESVTRFRARRADAPPSPRFRAVAAISSMVAANLPDADLFYTGVGGDRLAYMLHHRGYTHTVVIALLGAALVWGAAWLVLRRRASSTPERGEAGWLLGLLVMGTMSHLALDWTNSYGVHPFWPFDNLWRYGDAMFIIEPWLWAVSVPALVAATTNRVARTLLCIVFIVGLAAAWRVEFVSVGAAAVISTGAALSVVIARARRPGVRVAAALVGWMAVTLAMAAGAATARGTVLRAVSDADPSAEILDVVVTPLPTNPLCATVITVERSGLTYRVARARVSAAPSVTKAARCGSVNSMESIFRPALRQTTPAVQWEGEWTAPSEELATLARGSCRARSALRFIRAPIWRALDDSTVMLGDARFGGASGNAFTDVEVPRQSAICPDGVPPWTPPRTDLLDSRG